MGRTIDWIESNPKKADARVMLLSCGFAALIFLVMSLAIMWVKFVGPLLVVAFVVFAIWTVRD